MTLSDADARRDAPSRPASTQADHDSAHERDERGATRRGQHPTPRAPHQPEPLTTSRGDSGTTCTGAHLTRAILEGTAMPRRTDATPRPPTHRRFHRRTYPTRLQARPSEHTHGQR